MNKSEFARWMKDFRTRFPATGNWVTGLDKETLKCWYEDVFAAFELRDALAVNEQLMTDGELEAWQREKIPAIFIRKLQEQSWRRRQRELDAKAEKAEAERRQRIAQQRRRGGSDARQMPLTGTFTAPMRVAYDDLVKIRADHQAKHGQPMPDVDYRSACREYWQNHEI